MEETYTCNYLDSASVGAEVKKIIESGASSALLDGGDGLVRLYQSNEEEPVWTAEFVASDDISRIVTTSTWSAEDKTWHRAVEVLGSAEDKPAWRIANLLLSVAHQVELVKHGEIIREETFSRAFNLRYWIRNGYMPTEIKSRETGEFQPINESSLADLTNFIVSFLQTGQDLTLGRNCKLIYAPEDAAAYWEELKRLSGYKESGN